MDGGRPRESPAQPSWLLAKRAFYPDSLLRKVALLHCASSITLLGETDYTVRGH